MGWSKPSCRMRRSRSFPFTCPERPANETNGSPMFMISTNTMMLMTNNSGTACSKRRIIYLPMTTTHMPMPPPLSFQRRHRHCSLHYWDLSHSYEFQNGVAPENLTLDNFFEIVHKSGSSQMLTQYTLSAIIFWIWWNSSVRAFASTVCACFWNKASSSLSQRNSQLPPGGFASDGISLHNHREVSGSGKLGASDHSAMSYCPVAMGPLSP